MVGLATSPKLVAKWQWTTLNLVEENISRWWRTRRSWGGLLQVFHSNDVRRSYLIRIMKEFCCCSARFWCGTDSCGYCGRIMLRFKRKSATHSFNLFSSREINQQRIQTILIEIMSRWRFSKCVFKNNHQQDVRMIYY